MLVADTHVPDTLLLRRVTPLSTPRRVGLGVLVRQPSIGVGCKRAVLRVVVTGEAQPLAVPRGAGSLPVFSDITDPVSLVAYLRAAPEFAKQRPIIEVVACGDTDWWGKAASG